MKDTTKKTAGRTAKSGGFSDFERAAMKERAKELKAAKSGADATADVLAAIDAMPEPDRTIARALHAIHEAHAPDLAPRLWYGMPAYARPGKGGKVVFFFQGAAKFETRYATVNFTDGARLDEGTMWPVSFAVSEMTPANEARIAAMVRQAAG